MRSDPKGRCRSGGTRIQELVLDPLDDPRVSLVKDVAQIAAGIEVFKRVEH